jgi:hypothetical protein
MKRLFLAIGLAALLAPLPGSAQFPPGGFDAGANRLVQEWYSRFLSRATDPYASVWVEAIRSGQAPETVLAQILASDEYYQRAGNSPEGFVRKLHQDLTGRPPAPREAQFWIAQVYRAGRQDVAYQMLMRYPQDWGRAPSSRFRDDWDRSRAWERREPEAYEFRRPWWSRALPRR